METMEAILSRRSIRKYTNEIVEDDLIRKLLEAGMSAPSAGNERPWHFVVIKDRKILDEIPNIHPYAAMTREASVAIVVCGDLSLEAHEGFWIMDCSAAVENILIAAQANGLGTVWTGLYPREERVKGIRKLLGMPEHVVPMALIPIGYPAEKKPKENRFDKSRVHDDKW